MPHNSHNTPRTQAEFEQNSLIAWLPHGQPNVGQAERLFSLLGGGALALWGLSRRGVDGLLLAAAGGGLMYRGLTGHCEVYQALGIDGAAQKPTTSIPSGQGIKFEECITIRKSPQDLFDFWRDFENLPRIMDHLVSVECVGENKSHWVAKGPTGNVEWDAVIVNERRPEIISWRSLPDSDVQTAGSIRFRAQGAGTEVKVVMSYNPPAGRVGATLAWLTGQNPERQVREDLDNFKRIMETGSIPSATI